jgi:putative transcriptional regulator
MKHLLFILIIIVTVGCDTSESIVNKDKTVNSKEAIVKQGQYIVAIPNFPGPNFINAVVLVTHVTDENITGVIINGVQSEPLGDLVEEYKGSKLRVTTGGPVKFNEALVNIHTLDNLKSNNEIFPGLYFLGTLDSIADKLNANEISPNEMRTFSGYVGWSVDQFADEFKNEKVWIIMDGNLDEIMAPTEERTSLWTRLIERNKR